MTASPSPTDSSPLAPLPCEPCVGMTARAAARIKHLAAQESAPDRSALRLAVSGGGCSGFQYHFSFDADRAEDDRLFMTDGACIVIDAVSLELLAGSELDYIEDLMGSYFKVNNPNASSSCGCGASFAVTL
jgi:iron-sulfur cluster insertion protein